MQRILILFLFLSVFEIRAQGVISIIENDSIIDFIKIKKDDSTQLLLYSYVGKYRQKGWILSSIDSIFERNDTVFAIFFKGEKYFFGQIKNSKTNEINKNFENKAANLIKIDEYFEKKISTLNNSGYPFAKLNISNFKTEKNKLSIDYFIDNKNFVVYDSLFFNPKVRISKKFLQNYLNCQKKKPYNHQNFKTIDKKIGFINCLNLKEPTQIEFRSNSADIYLYIENKKISTFSGALAVELKDKKINLIGQADIQLINIFKTSDQISLQWNKISSESQLINSHIDIPYILSTKTGFSNNFSFKQIDTSLFTFNNTLYLNYFIVAYSRVSFLYQFKQNISFDTLTWGKSLKQNFWGLSLYNTTLNDLFVPTKGIEYKVNISINPYKKEKNAFVLDIFSNFYFQITKTIIMKLSSTNMYYQSEETQKNELYSIGGANLLRGFEQNAFLCSSYSVNTAELRWIFAKYSFIGTFFDFAFFKDYEKNSKYANSFGLTFQINTKQTIFGLTIALGSVEKQKFDFRQTKIHLKISNFF